MKKKNKKKLKQTEYDAIMSESDLFRSFKPAKYWNKLIKKFSKKQINDKRRKNKSNN